MKWIKTSDRLPDKEGNYFCYQDNIHKVLCGFNFKDGFTGSYITHWLDESEKEITDTQRLDWLANEDNILYLLDNHDRALTKEDLREFIDKQIKKR